ncbi:replication stress response regulator SDE2-like [Lingula anatina]|uniref:Replication stress response regulator SDE2-like n=1 Tax=Lingula anatina TaxID=7574 RepID=A0A1S3H210_LINAN|nr:replication stress response regulator SDE2-like [Lingula anatina]|eukprot:XP_013379516.1 replication stress response regulator SDE2-like [Lingula anatina]
MFNIFVTIDRQKVRVYEACASDTICSIKEQITKEIKKGDFYLVCNGLKVADDAILHQDQVYHVCHRLPGGKGGFGSMLRAIGAQIEKTTNREACRDLSGRRMRDINNEKKYDVAEVYVDKSVNERCLQKAKPSASATVTLSDMSRKRKMGDTDSVDMKKKCKEMLGLDMEDLSDLSSDSDSESSSDSQPSTSNTGHSNGSKAPVDSDSDTNVPGPSGGYSNLGYNYKDGSKSPSSKPGPSQVKGDLNSASSSVSSTDIGQPRVQDKTTEQTSPGSLFSNATKTVSGAQGLLGQLPSPQGQEKKPVEQGTKENVTAVDPVNLEEFESQEALEQLGLDRLKCALMALGLKCGGTLQERASRLWSVKGKTPDEIDPALFAKPTKKKGSK